MKNIYFYIFPEKKLAEKYVAMSEVQIDNSLDYWNPKDIIVVTNFLWEYHGVKSIVVSEEVNCKVMSHGTSSSNKPNIIKYLIEHNLVDEMNWFHDWDVFQLAALDLPLISRDIGFVEYGYKPGIQLGSIFFKPTALDVFKGISESIERLKRNEEDTVNILIRENFNNINARFTKLNATYNIGMINLKGQISVAEKPFKIAHFPPYDPKYLHKSSKVIPQKLFQMLSDRFSVNN